MPVVKRKFKVEYLENPVDPAIPIDISAFVATFDDFSIESTGKISSAKFTLNAEFGQFITDNNANTTPIISQFDKMRITIIDDAGVERNHRILYVKTDLAQLANQSSHLLPLELQGREIDLSGVPFGGFFRSMGHKAIAFHILTQYTKQKGTKQPSLQFIANDLQDINPAIWDFTQVDNCYDALLAVVAHANLPVSAGGLGNRFAIIFEDDATTPITLLRIRLIKQGENNSPTYPILQQNASHPITKIDKIEQSSTGTVVVARGRPKTGTMPSKYSQFVSKLEFYRNVMEYDATIIYPTDSYVKSGGLKYKANQTVPISTPPPSVHWTAIDVGDYIGIFQYSPWTDGKATGANGGGPIKNGFANPTGLFDPNDFDSVAIPDHNLVIKDTNTTRVWALMRSNTTLITANTYLNKYLFNETDFIEGTTVLVDTSLGAVGGDFIGNDENGVPYANNIAVFRVPFNSTSAFGVWIVEHITANYDQCAVYAEGRIFEYNKPFVPADRTFPAVDRNRGGVGSFAWRDVSNAFLGNDCFHNPLSIETVNGLFGDTVENTEPLNDPSAVPYIFQSGLKITFGYDQTVNNPDVWNVWNSIFRNIKVGDGLQQLILGLGGTIYNNFATPTFGNLGWWFAWATPYPLSTHNGISEEIGELYGGDVNTLNRHRYFDMFNIEYTPTGQIGWTHDDSDDLSEITGVQFLFNYDITSSDIRVPFTGDIPFSYWCLDDRGTIWKSQKVLYRHLGETQPIKIEFGDLSPVFRARTPLGLDNVLDNIIVPEIENNNVMFKDRVILQGFQCDVPYDEYGRYSPSLWEQIMKPTFFDLFNGGVGNVKFIGIIDGFCFTKTPIAISAPSVLSGERTIIPNFIDYQNIINVEQLQRFADAQEDVEVYQYEQYTVEQGGIADRELEDTVTLYDQYLINNSDAGANTRNVAVRELHYSVPKDRGLIRKAVLVKKIT